MKLRFVILSIFFCHALFSFILAQDVILQGHTHRQVEKAERISSPPELKQNIAPQPIISYPLLPVQFIPVLRIDSIRVASLKIREQLSPLYNTHIKLGIGTKMMPLADLSFASRRSRKYHYGGSFQHLSSLANIPDFERNTFDRTSVDLYGQIIDKNYQLKSNFKHSHRRFHYYAIQAPLDSLGKDKTRQRYNTTSFDISYKNRAKVSDLTINYDLLAKYSHLNTIKPPIDSLIDWRTKENNVKIIADLHTLLDENKYALTIDIFSNQYKYGNPTDTIIILDTALTRNNFIFALKPSITTDLWNRRFRTVVGLNFTLDHYQQTKAYIYPNIEVKYALFNNLIIPYAGIRGGLKPTTFETLASENEFIRPNIELKNEHTPLDFYGGLKGTLSQNMAFNIGVNYAFIHNLVLFANDTIFSAGNQFMTLYDQVKRMTIEGMLSYQQTEKIKIDIIGKFHSYEMSKQTHAWNRPQLEFSSSIHYNLYDKIYAHLDFSLFILRYALVYAPGKDIFSENNQYYRKLESISDFNFSLEYRYTQRLSAFVEFNNLTGKRYQRWYHAPVHGFQIMAGITFRF